MDLLGTYLWWGVTHILPHGVDHVLFILALYFSSRHVRPLIWQVTAFTAAHTLTLALAALGLIDLPSRLVETLIAVSIAYAAAENLFRTEPAPWRPALVFAFGLLHGLGFAGVLSSLGLPAGQTVPALLAFNVGVEIGQLAVLAAAFALTVWFREKAWYRRFVVMPVSALIALTALYWAVERAFLTA